jgi:ribosomal-protein-alanine N-acetyltransferase
MTSRVSLLPVRLLPYEPAFLRPFIAWRSEPLTVRHNPLKQMSDSEIETMLLAESADLALLGKAESFRWFITVGGEAVGSISLKNIGHSMGYGDLGYGIAESHRGKGIASAALRLLIVNIFAESTLRRLMAYVHEENQASRRVLEKLGFQEEGLLREHYLINGSPVNEVLYALLKKDWTSE